MNIEEGKKIILELLQKEGKSTNSKMLKLLDKNNDLLEEVREELIMDDLATDKGGAGLIYNEHQLDNTKAEIPKGDNVFVSYGRKDALSFARNLQKDLRNKGFEVWMDELKIQHGKRWEVPIEMGINHARVVLAVLTPHAVRPTSVCRKEISFAIFHGKKVVPVKIHEQRFETLNTIGLDWIDFSGDYNIGLQMLIKYLKGNTNELRSPVLASITGVTPFDFAYEVVNFMDHFVGREWLNKEIDSWINDTNNRTMIITGEAGIGKSAIAAWISQKRAGQVVSHHFCTRRNMRTLDPYEYVAALVAQLASQIPEYYEIVKELNPEKRRNTASFAFKELVSIPLNQIKTKQSIKLFIIDSLDESIIQEGETVLNVIINEALKLPEWIRLICTTRPEKQIIDKIQHLNTFELKAGRKENLEDVENYIYEIFDEEELPLHIKEESKFIFNKLTSLANGNFLYVKMAMDALINDNFPVSKLKNLKGELTDFYLQVFKQRFDNIDSYSQKYAPLLSILVASQGPLSKELLSSCLQLDEKELNIRLQPIRIYTRRIANPEGIDIVFQHKSLRDWLVNKSEAGSYVIDPIEGHNLLAETLLNIWQDDEYAIQFLPMHLIEAKRWDDLAILLGDIDFYDAYSSDSKKHELMIFWLHLLPYKKPEKIFKETIKKLIDKKVDQKILFDFTYKITGLLRNMGLYSEALPFAEQSLSYLINMGQSETEELANAHRELAEVFRLLKEFDSALKNYNTALKIYKEQFGENSSQVATIYHDFAEFYRDKGNLEEAIRFNKTALSIRKKMKPIDIPGLADCINDTGVMIWESTADNNVLQYYEEALKLFKSFYGEMHYDIATVIGNIGDVSLNNKEIDKALENYKEAYDMAKLFRVINHFQLINVRNQIIMCLLIRNQIPEAIPYQKDKIRSEEISNGLGSIPVINSRYYLIELYNKIDKKQEAYKVYLENKSDLVIYLQKNQSVLSSKEKVELLTLLRYIALICIEHQNYHDAEEIYTLLLENNFEIANTHCHLARMYFLTGKENESRFHTEEAWKYKSEGKPYLLPRILFFQIVFELLDGKEVPYLLSEINELLKVDESHLYWSINPVLDLLNHRLEAKEMEILNTLARDISKTK